MLGIVCVKPFEWLKSGSLNFLRFAASVKYADFLAKAGKADIALTGTKGAFHSLTSSGIARD